MPLKRTPPSSPAPPAVAASTQPTTVAPAQPPVTVTAHNPTRATPALDFASAVPAMNQLQNSSSVPNLSGIPSNISFRKRKHPELDESSLQKFMSDMKEMFDDFKAGQQKQSEKILSALEELRSSVQFLSGKYDALQATVSKLETDRNSDTQYIKTLEEKLDNFERNSRSTCLEIRNIPSPPSESKATLLETFMKTGKALNVPLQPSDVKDIFRIQTKDPANKTIIVDLTSALKKEKVISMFRQFNKGSSRLSTEHLHISGPARPIFLSENLTSKMKRLYYLAREAAKEHGFMFCWVSHGKIFLRKRENAPHIRITKESDLTKVNEQK